MAWVIVLILLLVQIFCVGILMMIKERQLARETQLFLRLFLTNVEHQIVHSLIDNNKTTIRKYSYF